MKAARRLLAAATCLLLTVGPASTPASAHDWDYDYPVPNGWVRDIVCPHPHLVTPYGPLSLCTSGFGVPQPSEYGYYSPLTNEFTTNLEHYPAASRYPVERYATGTDGVRGSFRGGYELDIPGFGRLSYGIQYTVYLTVPVGRFGNYSFITGRFHPSSEWYHVEAGHGI